MDARGKMQLFTSLLQVFLSHAPLLLTQQSQVQPTALLSPPHPVVEYSGEFTCKI